MSDKEAKKEEPAAQRFTVISKPGAAIKVESIELTEMEKQSLTVDARIPASSATAPLDKPKEAA